MERKKLIAWLQSERMGCTVEGVWNAPLPLPPTRRHGQYYAAVILLPIVTQFCCGLVTMRKGKNPTRNLPVNPTFMAGRVSRIWFVSCWFRVFCKKGVPYCNASMGRACVCECRVSETGYREPTTMCPISPTGRGQRRQHIEILCNGDPQTVERGPRQQ